jgi:NAD+ kinase
MLHSIHRFHKLNKPIYGINCGSLGFLLNTYDTKSDLYEKITQATSIKINPLTTTFTNSYGENKEAIAFNEISILRSDSVASHLKVIIDNEVMINPLVCDGILVSTPMGSTAYNRACGGNIISLDSNLLAVTSINSFDPINWKGASIRNHHVVEIENLDTKKRKINLFADFQEFKNISKATIRISNNVYANLLFDPNNDLNHKILKTQFHK